MASVPEALDANIKPVLMMAEQKELEGLAGAAKKWDAHSFGEAFGYCSEEAEG
ncbi:MAG: hypothetical protein WCH37_11810 [Synechococcaceae cyanobacterium ELA182]